MAGKLHRAVAPSSPLIVPGRTRPLQTHLVARGRLRISGYEDGDVIRDLNTREVLAERSKDGWNRPVKVAREAAPRVYPAPIWPAVTVQLDKGRYY